jgi:hypothetical protein
MEIVGFNPVSTDVTLAINGAYCGTETDSIGEFLLALSFNPQIENIQDTYPCFYDNGWALLIFPLNFPAFEIGQGEDNILQTGDTVTFNLLETPLFGSGTASAWCLPSGKSMTAPALMGRAKVWAASLTQILTFGTTGWNGL